MTTIYKYDIVNITMQNISLPKGAEIFAVQSQFDQPKLWAMVDSEETETEQRTIEIFGTGHDIPVNMGIDRKYISTFQLLNGFL